jgi:maleate isomerase
VPYLNSVVEPELADLRPAGVSNQTARFDLDADVLRHVVDAAERLTTCGVEALVVGLATESFPGGLERLQQGVDDLIEKTSLPVFTASHASPVALRRLGVQRIAIATPFDAEGNSHVRAAFEASGFEVVAIDGLACADFSMIARVPAEEIRGLFGRVDCAAAEALVQVGTGLPILHLIDRLEEIHGKPVIGCNAAVYWQALRETGIDDKISGYGRLLAEC